MRLKAVFSGETKKYHYFLVHEGEKKVVGTFYIRKDVPLPEHVSVTLVTPNHVEWKYLLQVLTERSRVGSKGRQKLVDVEEQYSEGGFHE